MDDRIGADLNETQTRKRTMKYAETIKQVELNAKRFGVEVNVASVPDRLFAFWKRQGQSVQQMVMLCLEYSRCPESFAGVE
jgi:sulfur carrier protein ThiS